MKLVIDEKIPYMRGAAERLGQAVYLPGAGITAADVRDADALIVRTRTRCDRALLEGSGVRFVATATIGYDHIDADALAEMGIGWTNCPGCNARSVAQYVESALLLLAARGAWSGHAPSSADGKNSQAPAEVPQQHGGESWPLSTDETVCTPDAWPLSADGPLAKPDLSVFSRLTLGIVGVGHVGSEVERMARRLGFGDILLCDPPRAEREPGGRFVSLDELARRADIVTFHTPLTRAPQPHSTFHLADDAFFSRLRTGAVFINSSRGEVADTAAVKAALRGGRLRAAVIDTWENEPCIDPGLLSAAFLATPHVAGYSADGKANGTRMSLMAVARHFGFDPEMFSDIAAPQLPAGYAYYPEGGAKYLDPRLRLYDPLRDSRALKQHPECFEQLRGNYPLRREAGE